MAGGGERRRRGPDVAPGGHELTPLQRYILAHIEARHADGAEVISARELAKALNVSVVYAREQAHALVVRGLLGVRPGRRGGYFRR